MNTKRNFGTITKRGKTYLARYGYKGKKYSKTCYTEIAALQYLEREHLLIQAGEWSEPTKREKITYAKNLTFETYATEWVNNKDNLTDGTINNLKKYLKNILLPYFGEMKLNEITEENITKFWNSTNKNSTAFYSAKKLNLILNAAKKENLINENPYTLELEKPKRKAEIIVLTLDEIQTANKLMPDYMKIAIYLGCYHGLRSGEIRGLQRKHLNLKNGTINITQQAKLNINNNLIIGELKTGNSKRELPIMPKLIPMLTEHLNKYCPEPNDFLLADKRGNPIKWELDYNWSKARKTLTENKQHCRIHDWRHTFATNCLKAELPIKTVCGLLGHSKIDMSLYYQHLELDDKKQGINKLNNLLLMPEIEIIPIPKKTLDEYNEWELKNKKIIFDAETEQTKDQWNNDDPVSPVKLTLDELLKSIKDY